MERRFPSSQPDDGISPPIRSAATVLVIPAVILGVLAAAAAFAQPFANAGSRPAPAEVTRR